MPPSLSLLRAHGARLPLLCCAQPQGPSRLGRRAPRRRRVTGAAAWQGRRRPRRTLSRGLAAAAARAGAHGVGPRARASCGWCGSSFRNTPPLLAACCPSCRVLPSARMPPHPPPAACPRRGPRQSFIAEPSSRISCCWKSSPDAEVTRGRGGWVVCEAGFLCVRARADWRARVCARRVLAPAPHGLRHARRRRSFRPVAPAASSPDSSSSQSATHSSWFSSSATCAASSLTTARGCGGHRAGHGWGEAGALWSSVCATCTRRGWRAPTGGALTQHGSACGSAGTQIPRLRRRKTHCGTQSPQRRRPPPGRPGSAAPTYWRPWLPLAC